MEYTKEFKILIKESKENNQYVGLGNPNAKMLFVGKEAGMEEEKQVTDGSAESWINGSDYSIPFCPESEIRKGNHTWQKYQKLYDLIIKNLNIELPEKGEDYKKITFVESVFTTELNNLHAPTTDKAKKREGFSENLVIRKDTFLKSDFIRNFPIVIITSADNKYIETYSGEVCEIFNVKYREQFICGKSNKIWVHYADEESEIYPKLVIHTRQLTNGASIDLLNKISEIIANFVEKHSIKIKVK